MDFRINLEKCFNASLTPTQYLFLYCLSVNHPFLWEIPDNQLETLENKGWIKITVEGAVIRDKFLTFASPTNKNTDNVSAWIDDWRMLWPAKLKTGGRPVKGDKQGCLRKMKVFVQEYSFTKEEIFEATQIYLFEKKRDNYNFITCADYFIIKNGASILAASCESVSEDGNSLTESIEGSNKHFRSI
jgi:hypothetical protein|tara:strand:+ start:4463 stop:5023 length:561 start_codon:yes stop_codon:yes gene_type:complete